MTIICAQHVPGSGTWIGCDRRAVMHGTPVDNRTKWINVTGDYWMGVSGRERMLTILRAANLDRKITATAPLPLVENLRHILPDYGWTGHQRDDVAPQWDSSILLAHPHGLWHIDAAMSLTDLEDRFWAVGSGADYALGSAFALADLDANDRVECAIQAAIAHDVHCGGEPWIKFLEAK